MLENYRDSLLRLGFRLEDVPVMDNCPESKYFEMHICSSMQLTAVSFMRYFARENFRTPWTVNIYTN